MDGHRHRDIIAIDVFIAEALAIQDAGPVVHLIGKHIGTWRCDRLRPNGQNISTLQLHVVIAAIADCDDNVIRTAVRDMDIVVQLGANEPAALAGYIIRDGITHRRCK